jgi:hypothetical protein
MNHRGHRGHGENYFEGNSRSVYQNPKRQRGDSLPPFKGGIEGGRGPSLPPPVLIVWPVSGAPGFPVLLEALLTNSLIYFRRSLCPL